MPARLGNESRVLHRDDRLRREVLQQGDLLVGEWPDFLARSNDLPEQRFVLAQRHTKRRPNATELCHTPCDGIVDLRQIEDVGKLVATQQSPVWQIRARPVALSQALRRRLRQAMHCNGAEHLTVEEL